MRRELTKLASGVLLGIMCLVLVAVPVLAQTYYAIITVLETGSNAYTMFPSMTSLNVNHLIDSDYIRSDGRDTKVMEGTSPKPHMLTHDQLLFADGLPADSSSTYLFETGYTGAELITDFDIITGYDGYITIPDDNALELGNNFEIDQRGWVDTDAGSGKNLIIKDGAVLTYVSDDTDITSAIGGTGQPIVGGGYNDVLNPAAIEYNSLMGAGIWRPNENERYQCIPTGGTIDGLYVRLNVAPGVGDSYTFTLMKNGAPTALAVTISGAVDTTGNDWGAIAVVAADTVSLRSSFAGVPAVTAAQWSTLWKPTIAGESICLVSARSNAAGTTYAEIQGRATVPPTGETQIQAPIPTAGTFKKLYVQLSADPGNPPDAFSFTLRVAAVDTALTCTITADATTGNDAVNTVAVVVGDLVDIEITALNAPAIQPECAIGMVFVSDTDGESLIMGGSKDQTAANSTEYLGLCGSTETWGVAEASHYSLIQMCRLEKLYVSLDTAPGGADTYTVSIREEGADTGLTVTITGAEKTGNDVVNTYVSSNGDVADTRYISSATVALTRIHWGLVAANPVASVTVAGVASGVRRVVSEGDGVNLTLSVYDSVGVHQGNSPQNIAFAGAVADSSSDWVLMQNNAMPYMEYYKHTVGGTLIARYQPVTIIKGENYTGGTATFVNGSTDVVGAGTTWTEGMEGSLIKLNADDIWEIVDTVTDNTNLVLVKVYSDAGGNGNYTMESKLPNEEGALGEDYTEGTAIFVNGNVNVVGVLTNWTSAMEGSRIKLDADAIWEIVDTVTNVTNLVLVTTYSDAGGNGDYTMEEGALQDGIITWGANPAGVAISWGSLISYREGLFLPEGGITPGVGGEISPPDDMFPSEEEMAGKGFTWLEPTVRTTMELTDTPIFLAWILMCAMFILMVAAAAHKYLQNLAITGFCILVAIGMCVGMAFMPSWVILVAILIVMGLLVMERSPSV